MIVMAANTPLKWREFWFKSLRISDDYLSSVVPNPKTYEVSNKEGRKMILAIKKKLKARQKSQQSQRTKNDQKLPTRQATGCKMGWTASLQNS